MAVFMRVTGAWTQLLAEWLDREKLAAPEIRARLASWAADDRVEVDQWRELLQQAIALKNDQPAPELAIGAGVMPHHVGVLGYLVMSVATLGEAMVAYQRYEQLFYGASLAQVSITRDYAEICWSADTAQLGQQGDGVAIAALVTFLQKQTGKILPPLSVSFVHSLSNPDAYSAFFDCPVNVNDSHIRVRFPLAYLQIPMPLNDPELRRMLDRQAQALLQALPDSSDFERALQQILVKRMPEGELSLPQIAQQAHMSVRTLQRRLAARGMSWQYFLDRTREHLARDYLGDQGLPLSDVAILLGYAEQSAFSRAFRRWTGQTPSRWRKHIETNTWVQ